MSTIFNIIKRFISNEKFEATASTNRSDEDKKTLQDKIITLLFNFSLFVFLLLYLTKIDSYVPESYNMKNIIKVIASTYFFITVLVLITNIIELFN